MHLSFLRFPANPAFVIPWYVVGAIAAAWVSYDTLAANRCVASMITVMVGIGLVMRFLTPISVGDAPQPNPMNRWLVKIGWKHGMA